jgi:hypothetical protein
VKAVFEDERFDTLGFLPSSVSLDFIMGRHLSATKLGPQELVFEPMIQLW